MKIKFRNRIFLFCLLIAGCTSNFDENNRNKDIFDEAKTLSQVSYTTTNYDFDGNIANLRTLISALGINTVTALDLTGNSLASRTITGVVTVPSSADFLMFSSVAANPSCRNPFRLYSKVFVVQDQNSAVLIAYGRNPALLDSSDAQLLGFGTTSMEYITNSNRADMAVLGDKIRIVVKAGINYGSGGNSIPIITDFESREVLSKNNSLYFSEQATSTAFDRTTDLYKNKRISGIVKTTPAYSECPSGVNRDFQLANDLAYVGVLNVGGTVDANGNITGGTDYKFRLSQALAQGTLSTFNVATQFSYTLAKGARVRMTGPVFIPNRGGADSDLMILLDQKSQVENLQ